MGKEKTCSKNNRKGEVSTSVLILVIISIVSFIVIFFFIRESPGESATNREICHNSIVLRASVNSISDFTKIVPLKCQAEKICLSMSGNDCNEIVDTKDNPVKKIKLDKDESKAREKIKEVFADSLVSCHSMLGEGNLNFLSDELTEQSYGLICTRIVFDDEVKNNLESISYGEFYGYLESQVTNGESYLDYLYPGVGDSGKFLSLYHEESERGNFNGDFKNWKIDFKQENGYAIIAQETVKGNLAAWGSGLTTGVLLGGGVLALGSVVGAPIGLTLLTLAGASGTFTGGMVFWYESNDKFVYSPPAIYPFDVDKLINLGVKFEITS